MTNAEIAAVLEQVADLLEFKDENPFRVRAYRNGARAIRDLTNPSRDRGDNWERLLEIDGVGKAVAEKSGTLVRPAPAAAGRTAGRDPRERLGHHADSRHRPEESRRLSTSWASRRWTN
jgi:hypothetical protein